MNLFIFNLMIYLMVSFSPFQKEEVPGFEITILEHRYFKDLSSLSAIGMYSDNIYAAGDDIPWLIQLDPGWNIKNKIKIAGKDSLVNGRTPSAVKADYECMEIFNYKATDYLLILSSGSKKITRDTAVLITLPGKQKVLKKNIRPLYEKIKRAAGFDKKEEINIEGLAVAGEKTFLFHRGNISGNFIVTMNTAEFIQYLKSNDNVSPDIEITRFRLPEYHGVQSGFSGACALPDHSGLLFTASMEDTKSVTADGEVTGSYIGFIPFSGLAEGRFSAKIVTDGENLLKKKMEAVTIKEKKHNNFVLFVVSDNDDGSSDGYRIGLKFNR
ncbi:MAG: hypothetical protein GXO86_15010 [Chlorobi bacterium]|nr:hypothetical protein [Chlorobiota bacterium]